MKRPQLILLITLLLAASAWLVESRVLHSGFKYSDIAQFKHNFLSADNILQEHLEQLTTLSPQSRKEQTETFNTLFDSEGICYFILEKQTITYWSDNRIILPQNTEDLKDKTLVKLPAGWFYCRVKQTETKQYIGLLLLKSDYPITNKYIHNNFNPLFTLPANVHLYTSSLGKNNDIVNTEGKFAFSLLFPKEIVFTRGEVLVPILLYTLAFLLFLGFCQILIKRQKTTQKKLIVLLGESILLLALRQLLLYFNIPNVFYQLNLFSPKLFAYSNFFPSLGDITIFTIIVFYIVYTFTSQIPIKQQNNKTEIKGWTLRITLSILFISLFFFNIWLYKTLIFNSNISFEANKIMRISFSSLLGLLIITSYFSLLYLLTRKTFDLFALKNEYKAFLLTFFSGLIAVLAIALFIGFYINWPSVFIFALAISLSSYLRLVKEYKHNYHVTTALLLIYAIFSAYFIQSISEKKRNEAQKVIALRLASEHDPVAENLFAEMRNEIRRDTLVLSHLSDKSFRFDLLMSYLRQRYFNGYFEKYDFQLTVCRSNDTLKISPEDIDVPCFSFFETMIGTKGEKLPRSDFYYVNYGNSRISYLGLLRYQPTNCGITHLYIELDAKLSLQELGYPDLLLDEKLSRQQINEEYSFARYYKGNLIAQSGHYLYSRTPDLYNPQNKEFSIESFNGYKHLFYKPNKDNLLLLSRPDSGFVDALISFSYIFVVLLVLFNLSLFFVYLKKIKSFITLTFENKIKYSLAGLLLFSLLLVAGASAFYTKKQFKEKHNALISEKMQSVYREISQRLGFEELKDASLNNVSQRNMEVMLRTFSNIFYSDINVYNPQGELVSSSRPEVFDKNLLSTLMNREAFEEISNNNSSEYVHYERIGNMQYMSAYMPMINAEGAIIGYLNLPYFAKQSELWAELYNQLFTLLNFYILLMLVAISLSVIISRRITQPLRWIQDRFSHIKLGDRSSKIEYKGNDEIGALIGQYNRMVEELNRNMELLAKSERESAWREMAKQIAHEIKNPLTPMKLSLQHLVRAWNDKVENWDEYLVRVTQTIIEQIDNLTAIANEFSNFAKMPKPNSITFPISSVITDVMQLYSGSGTTIRYRKHVKTEPEIFADKEQITRVFINLVTNSLQAITPGKKGKINIDIYDNENGSIRIEFSDNGIGISPAIGGKLFEPNFTTKSGGMGLGLAIVKNIVENAGGAIYYRSIQDEGTTFSIELPLAKR